MNSEADWLRRHRDVLKDRTASIQYDHSPLGRGVSVREKDIRAGRIERDCVDIPDLARRKHLQRNGEDWRWTCGIKLEQGARRRRGGPRLAILTRVDDMARHRVNRDAQRGSR